VVAAIGGQGGIAAERLSLVVAAIGGQGGIAAERLLCCA
jgi:hypothetical protein